MTNEEARLAELFGAPQRRTDAEFVESVMREVLVEERLRAARLASWRACMTEAAATAAIVGAALVLSEHLRAAGMTGLLVLALFASWVLMVGPRATALS